MTLSRRHMISAAATGAAFAGFSRLAGAQPASRRVSPDADPYLNEVAGYGALAMDPQGLFDLPEGFSYTIVSRAGEFMSDGLVTPRKMDGMGCFPLDADRVVLVRNHELKTTDVEYGPFGSRHALATKLDRSRVYGFDKDDQALSGGTTSLIYDLRKRRLESSHLSLAGTLVNCSGGATPWNSWLSCEETVDPVTLTAGGHGGLKSHGWVFEVPGSARGLADPTPILGMGRFRHEAVCIDPRTGIAYLTEDEGAGLFYRYLPEDRRVLQKGGRLQALAFRDRPEGGDSRNWTSPEMAPGDWRDVVWVDMDGVDNPDNALKARGHAKGAVLFARGEGVFFGKNELYFTCTNGGPKRLGQIMRYRPSRFEGDARERDEPGKLQLFVESHDKRVMNMCDNIAVAPWGDLIVCEDKAGAGGVNYLRAVTPAGKTYTLGRQAQPGASDVGANTELAGACFSPDGTTLFVNVYWPGMTVAIIGPWGRRQA